MMAMQKEFLYQRIYEDLFRDISNGVYSSDERLPSEKELAERYQVSRITSKKALEILEENGYITRAPGRGSFINMEHKGEEKALFRGQRHREESRMIGIIVEDFAENFGTMILAGAERICSEKSYNLILKRSNGSQEQEASAIQTLLNLGVDGILVMPVHGDNYNPMILKLAVEAFPFVLIDRELKGIPASFVGTDNLSAAKNMTDYLFELGHRNICFVGPSEVDTSTVQQRIEGFTGSCMEHESLDGESSVVTNIISTLPGRKEPDGIAKDAKVIKQYLREHPETTAFFAVEYNIALIVYKAIYEMGKKIPDDYTVVCFDSPPNYIDQYTFTHIRQDEVSIGRKSGEFLLNQIHGGTIEKCSMNGQLVHGNSTRKID